MQPTGESGQSLQGVSGIDFEIFCKFETISKLKVIKTKKQNKIRV